MLIQLSLLILSPCSLALIYLTGFIHYSPHKYNVIVLRVRQTSEFFFPCLGTKQRGFLCTIDCLKQSMGLFKANSCRQPYWKQFIDIHEATWLPTTFEGNQIASKLPGVWWPLCRNPASRRCIEFAVLR